MIRIRFRHLLIPAVLSIVSCDSAYRPGEFDRDASRAGSGQTERSAYDAPGDSDAVDAPQTQRSRSAANVDSGERIAPDSGLPASIRVFFSNAYVNNPQVGQKDSNNIDRRLAAFIASARSTVDCALFELASGRIANALIAAHRRGVRVRIVGDADYRDDAEMLRVLAAGIPVVFDERSAFMHDKFVVVDDVAVWTGSYNATDNCSYRNNNNAVLLRSAELAEDYASEFAEMFTMRRFGARSPSNTPHSLVKLDGADVYCYFGPEDDLRPKVVRFLKAARTSIHFMAFSFTDDEIGEMLRAKQAAGITVSGVIETQNAGARAGQIDKLRGAGVEVVTDGNSRMMHHKVFVIDGLWTVTGSYNFTVSGAEQNDENVLVIKNRAVARAFEREFKRIRRMAQRPTPTSAHRTTRSETGGAGRRATD